MGLSLMKQVTPATEFRRLRPRPGDHEAPEQGFRWGGGQRADLGAKEKAERDRKRKAEKAARRANRR